MKRNELMLFRNSNEISCDAHENHQERCSQNIRQTITSCTASSQCFAMECSMLG